MSQKFIGDTSYKEQPSRRRDGLQGSFLIRRWHGATSQKDSFLLTIPGGWTDRSIEEDGDWTSIEVTYGIDPRSGSTSPTIADPITRIWTLQGTDEQIPLRDMPEIVAIINTLRDVAKGGSDPTGNDAVVGFWKTFDEAKEDGTLPSKVPWNNDTMDELYTRELTGQTSKLYARWILAKNQTVVGTSMVRASHQNVGRLYTYSALLSSEPTLQSEAPLLDLNSLNQATKLYWRKLPPSVQPLARGEYQITQSYESFEEFDRWVYKSEIK